MRTFYCAALADVLIFASRSPQKALKWEMKSERDDEKLIRMFRMLLESSTIFCIREIPSSHVAELLSRNFVFCCWGFCVLILILKEFWGCETYISTSVRGTQKCAQQRVYIEGNNTTSKLDISIQNSPHSAVCTEEKEENFNEKFNSATTRMTTRILIFVHGKN